MSFTIGYVSMVGNGASGVDFRLFGPVKARIGAACLDMGQPRQRAVLAALLVDVGLVVFIDTLIARVWGEKTPEHVTATLRVYV